jgi:hypothetical protein
MARTTDTYTTLNSNVTTGDKMDESAVTQAPDSSKDAVSVKRPRVVTGGDDGSIQDYRSKNGITAAAVYDVEMINLMRQVLSETIKQKTILNIILNRLSDTIISDAQLDAFGSAFK